MHRIEAAVRVEEGGTCGCGDSNMMGKNNDTDDGRALYFVQSSLAYGRQPIISLYAGNWKKGEVKVTYYK